MSDEVSDLIIVLASKDNLERFVGPVPAELKDKFRFVKSDRTWELMRLLPRCKLLVSKGWIAPLTNLWVFRARRMGIPTLLLIDGPLEWSNSTCNPSLRATYPAFDCALYDPLIHDAVATIGHSQTRWLSYRNDKRGIAFVSQRNKRIHRATSHHEKEHMKTDAQREFLVTTAKTPYFSDLEKRQLVNVLRRCCETIEKAGYSYSLRIFDKELQLHLPEYSFSTDGDFGYALSQCRCVIGTPSSVLLEAMDQGKPTATLVFRDTPLFYQTGWLLGCSDDWRSTLQSMLEGDRKRMDFQRFVLKENLSEENFFDHCRKALADDFVTDTRPKDIRDLEFENAILHKVLGWKARILAPGVRGLQRLRKGS